LAVEKDEEAAFSEEEPICVDASRNVTVPVGDPAPDFGATITAK
jgi:hypothetical protein